MDEVVIFHGCGQYNLTLDNAVKLGNHNIAYYCGEKNEDCPFQSFPEEPQAICSFWHFTDDFQNKHVDNFDSMCNAMDKIK